MGDGHPAVIVRDDGKVTDIPKHIDFIQHLSVLSLKPNDVIVLKSPHVLRDEYRKRLADVFRDLGFQNKVVLLEDIDVGIMRPL